MGAKNPLFKAYEKFISTTYLREIAFDILFALVDATTKPILFGDKDTKCLTDRNKRHGARHGDAQLRVERQKTAAIRMTTHSCRIWKSLRLPPFCT